MGCDHGSRACTEAASGDLPRGVGGGGPAWGRASRGGTAGRGTAGCRPAVRAQRLRTDLRDRRREGGGSHGPGPGGGLRGPHTEGEGLGQVRPRPAPGEGRDPGGGPPGPGRAGNRGHPRDHGPGPGGGRAGPGLLPDFRGRECVAGLSGRRGRPGGDAGRHVRAALLRGVDRRDQRHAQAPGPGQGGAARTPVRTGHGGHPDPLGRRGGPSGRDCLRPDGARCVHVPAVHTDR